MLSTRDYKEYDKTKLYVSKVACYIHAGTIFCDPHEATA